MHALGSIVRLPLARLAFAAALATALLGAAPAARAANFSLYVSFFANGTITVTTPDGAAVGTTSGSPTPIPAGYYSLVFSGPGGCIILPNFHLSGPGVNLVSNMTEAQGQKNPAGVTLLPGSTYAWSDDSSPGVLHTFTTSAQVEGSPPADGTGTTGTAPTSGKPVTSQDIVGSAVTASRGTLTAVVAPSGALELAYRGSVPTTLRAGDYTVVAIDRSGHAGLAVHRSHGTSRGITGSAFEGRRSATLDLTAGTWLFTAGSGKPRTVVVH